MSDRSDLSSLVFNKRNIRRLVKRFSEYTRTAAGCHEWKGWVAQNGYGYLRVSGHDTPAHRIAWVLANGSLPVGACVLHSCDNRKCINAAHMRLGTRRDNINDMKERGRVKRTRTDDKRRMLQMLGEGRSVREVSDMFGVPMEGVRNLSVHGVMWPNAFGKRARQFVSN